MMIYLSRFWKKPFIKYYFQLHSLYTMVMTTAKASIFVNQVSFHIVKVSLIFCLQIFKIFDTDGNGVVDFREFMMATATTALFLINFWYEKQLAKNQAWPDLSFDIWYSSLLSTLIIMNSEPREGASSKRSELFLVVRLLKTTTIIKLSLTTNID